LLGQSFASRSYNLLDQVDQAGILKQSGSLLPALSDTVDGVLSSMDQFSNDFETLKQALGFDYLDEANACSKTVAPFGVTLSGSHAFLNGTFSASRAINGPLKMELPSLQDTESDPNSWLKYTVAPVIEPTELADHDLQSPTVTPSVKSECVSPRNSGLLEELLYEARALRSGKNQQLSVRSSSSSAATPCETTTAVSQEFGMCQEYWEEHPGSFLNEYTPFSGNSLTESTPPFSAASVDIFQLSKASPGGYI
jgi:transcription factor MYB, plant